MTGGPGTRDPGQIAYSNVTLTDMILEAYAVRPYQIKGSPSWLDSERFGVTAKVPKGASKEDLKIMLQGLLADRFKLAVHHETQEGRNYNLVVDQGGPKLKAPTDGTASEHATIAVDDSGSARLADNLMGRPVTLAGKHLIMLVSGGRVMLMANSQPVSALAVTLAKYMDGPVRDLTGLTGTYDFSLDFAPPAGMRMPQMGPPGECMTCTPDQEPPLSVFQAVKERLGLRLDANRGTIDLLVIDRAEKVPTEN
jgi:uncharacterized protein (TIGR03435 family)